ncbi:hypothetical protein OSB04_009871 [Centaurea solstitialis]|uniref:RanBD1 domain-containing protein n=1 Tax=Centaurea solstitialis TaxID=347529 RepID=A0AA38WCA9_9ASTR|nr:hypothetical protein OSB04_009871 [Centaurea solstitialis]
MDTMTVFSSYESWFLFLTLVMWFQSKKIMVGPQFDFQRAASTQQNSMGAPSLDMHRAESSRQHVRALNNQFASWVHTQLQNHPDELWEDGVHDYLTHASSIMEKFSDVVNWLKSNSTKSESLLEHGSHAAQKKLVTESKDNENISFQEKIQKAPPSVTTPIFATSSFAPSWNTGPLFNNQSSFTFGGGQSTISVKPDASNDADGVHEVKCKLYVKSTDPADKDAWKDRGTGQLSIKCKEGVAKGTKDSKPTVLVRNDVGRLLLNALLYPGIKTSVQKNSIVAIFHTADDNGSDNSQVVARTFLIRTKNQEDRDKLAAAIQEYAPAAAS